MPPEDRLMKRGDPRTRVPPQIRPDQAPRKLPNRMLRYCINVWVVLHFTAIIAAAGSIGPAPGYVLKVWWVFHPYLEFLFLNHGFNFYAPEPSSSMIMEFEAVRADGSTVTGQIPDRALRPRLLYQRHLLLTEHISLAPIDDRRPWYQSYARHLCRKYGAAKVHLTLVSHMPMPMEMVRNGGRLDDPITYTKLDLGEFSCDEP
jgi:hypothetical protein